MVPKPKPLTPLRRLAIRAAATKIASPPTLQGQERTDKEQHARERKGIRKHTKAQ
jgi:hypothetical protein